MDDKTSVYVGKDLKDEKGYPLNPNLAFLIYELANYSILVMQGGTRSGKTYSTVLYIVGCMIKYSGVKYGIVRASLPRLKTTVLQDFMAICKSHGIWSDDAYNKTDQVYRYNGNEVWFISAEDGDKLRGFTGDFIYINEAPELDWEPIFQILLRTKAKIVMDYNPSYPESWMYEKILTRKSVGFLRTTYLDNPYLSDTQLENILWMKENDPEQYMVYGLGERGKRSGQVYTNFEFIEDTLFPEDEATLWCLDFGFTPHPTALVRVAFKDNGRTMYAREEAYGTELMPEDILCILYFKGFDKELHTIIGDSAQPMNITQMRFPTKISLEGIADIVHRLGYDQYYDITTEKLRDIQLYICEGVAILQAIKPQNSVGSGIRMMKRTKVYVTKSSENVRYEYFHYQYKRNRATGKITGEVVKEFDHALDAMRYGKLWQFYNRNEN